MRSLPQVDLASGRAQRLGALLDEALQAGLVAIRAGGDVVEHGGEVEWPQITFGAKYFLAARIEKDERRGVAQVQPAPPLAFAHAPPLRGHDGARAGQVELHDCKPGHQLPDFGPGEALAVQLLALAARGTLDEHDDRLPGSARQ